MRIFVVTLGYNTPEMIEGAMQNFEATVEPSHHIIKTIFHCGFPLPDPEFNRVAINNLARRYGWWNPSIPNQGVMENWNVAIHDHLMMGEDDFLGCFDPDVRLLQKGWIPAMVEALQSDHSAVFCAAARTYHNEDWCVNQHGRTISTLPSGLRISRYRELIAWSMGMWKGEWLAQRPRNFKADNAIYGYAEHADLRLMQSKGKTWLGLTDFYDDHQSSVPLYTLWKQESAAKKTEATFDVWLQGRR